MAYDKYKHATIQAFRAMSYADQDALRDFRDRNGRSWKTKLCELWLSGKDEGAMRRLRNELGADGLYDLPKDF